VDVLVESVQPPLRLYVFGTGHDAVPVVGFGRALGWDVFVVDPRSRDATRERFAAADDVLAASPADAARHVEGAGRAACVVMNHDYDHDRACVGALLSTRAEYVGVLGPRRRTERMLTELGAASAAARLHAPVGLELGAESPHEIALAIVAEVKAATSGKTGMSLRLRPGPIHAGPLVASPEAAE
jgi:xanthine/CO dehydrogenase XdhC/CoxF family maturation factor